MAGPPGFFGRTDFHRLTGGGFWVAEMGTMGGEGARLAPQTAKKAERCWREGAAARGDSVRREGAPLNDIVRHDPRAAGKPRLPLCFTRQIKALDLSSAGSPISPSEFAAGDFPRGEALTSENPVPVTKPVKKKDIRHGLETILPADLAGKRVKEISGAVAGRSHAGIAPYVGDGGVMRERLLNRRGKASIKRIRRWRSTRESAGRMVCPMKTGCARTAVRRSCQRRRYAVCRPSCDGKGCFPGGIPGTISDGRTNHIWI